MRFALGPVLVLVFASEIFGQPEMPKGTWQSFNAPGKPSEVRLVIDNLGNGKLNVDLTTPGGESLKIVDASMILGGLTDLNQDGGNSITQFKSTLLIGSTKYFVIGFHMQMADRILLQVLKNPSTMATAAGGENPCEPHSVVLHD